MLDFVYNKWFIAEVDGKSAPLEVYGDCPVLTLAAGHHDVRLFYRDYALLSGTAVMLLCACVLAIAWKRQFLRME